MSLKEIISVLERQTISLQAISFKPPVSHTYNAYVHAWDLHLRFLAMQGAEAGKSFFLGMNPGPFGMNQTGVPFGSVPMVRDWMKLSDHGLDKSISAHPKRPIEGFLTKRAEVSGQRFWGLFSSVFGEPKICFKRIFVANYCPLMFVNSAGANLTPEVLAKNERLELETVCDKALSEILEILRPKTTFAIGLYAQKALERAGFQGELVLVPHPSPANPKSSKLWPREVEAQLRAHGVFD